MVELLRSRKPAQNLNCVALLMFDPEGRPPAGVSRWVAYGIPEMVTGFAEGEVSKAATSFVRYRQRPDD